MMTNWTLKRTKKWNQNMRNPIYEHSYTHINTRTNTHKPTFLFLLLQNWNWNPFGNQTLKIISDLNFRSHVNLWFWVIWILTHTLSQFWKGVKKNNEWEWRCTTWRCRAIKPCIDGRICISVAYVVSCLVSTNLKQR